MKCPNCGEPYKIDKDRYFKYRLVHTYSLCPYKFDFNQHSVEQIIEDVKWFLTRNFPHFSQERLLGRIKKEFETHVSTLESKKRRCLNLGH